MYCATFFKADCEGLSSVALLSSHMPFPSCTGPTLIDTQFGSMKHCTRQLPSLATFTDLITWPCSAFLLKWRIILIHLLKVLKIRIRDRNLTFFPFATSLPNSYSLLLFTDWKWTWYSRLYLAVNKFALDEWVKHELKVHPPKDLNDRAIKHRFSVDEGSKES